MVFSSHIFLYYFLPIALALYYLSLPITKRVWGGTTAWTLTAVSFVFYGWNHPIYCFLTFGSAVLDYCCGRGIVADQARGRTGTRFLLTSVCGQLALLSYFKYANLGVESWNTVMNALGAPEAAVADWKYVVLPVGISFYTFQTMSYTIDLWRKACVPARNFGDFMCYVSMFPQLVAGPIVRYCHVQDELVHRDHTFDKWYRGILFIQFGLAKKILIADILGRLADQAFATGAYAKSGPEMLGTLDAWIGALAFTFQIYFDFSGYSDMAIGLALLLGFSFPVNFNQPYRSVSITDFWRRWHISLSSWLRDYLYISLGGNRKGEFRTYVNLGLTMLLGGLWHGASWTFVAWGAYQGFWLIVEKLYGKKSFFEGAPKFVAITVTFFLVVLGWVVFKAPTLSAAMDYYGAMFGMNGAGVPALDVRPVHWIAFVAAAIVTWGFPTTQSIVARAPFLYVLAVQPMFLLALCQLHFTDYTPFLYFQF